MSQVTYTILHRDNIMNYLYALFLDSGKNKVKRPELTTFYNR